MKVQEDVSDVGVGNLDVCSGGGLEGSYKIYTGIGGSNGLLIKYGLLLQKRSGVGGRIEL